ncbi:ABC transporter permease [Pseudoduganella violacea]|uniref:Putative ABC transport system permease protein n=1 Tax=Pseudoduganella violacea TaxID=1715466 RepID=A0A7W5FTE4_9BURK|nr:FtsX-like permease family protein [Pseudoduganella violacea]MBB3118775.1 putative ABC transport system permease protein [Pseudoduganella violacea]
MLTKFQWLSMALKNAMRNRRRSLVTLAITATGTAAALLGGGFALYTYQSLAEASARDTGHLIVAMPAHFDGSEDVPLQYGLQNPAALTQRLLAEPAVQRVLPRLQFSGLVSNGDKTEIFLGTGVDATQEFLVKGPFMTRISGELLDGHPAAKGPGIVLGKGLAKVLNAQPGSVLTIMSTTVGGSLNALDVTVAGIVSSGITDIDKRLAMVDLGTAQTLLDTRKVSSLSVYLDEIEASDATAAILRAKLGAGLAVRTWLNQAQFYQSVKNLYNRIFGFLGVIVLVIVLLSVTNTLAMAVLERTREIGTLRAMGATPREVMRVFTLEGMLLGSVGAVLGMALAGGLAVALLFLGVQMPPPPGRTGGYPLVVTVSPAMYLGAATAVALLSALASLLVSRKASNQTVVEALAHV